MSIDHIAIALLGALPAWLSQSHAHSVRRWACIFGMLGVPFWLYASWKAQQWVLLVASVLYALAWLKGLYIHWLAPDKGKPVDQGLGTIQLAPTSRQ